MTKGQPTAHGGASDQPALLATAIGNARARPAPSSPGCRALARPAFVRDPAPAPHVGAEPCWWGWGVLGCDFGGAPGGSEPSPQRGLLGLHRLTSPRARRRHPGPS